MKLFVWLSLLMTSVCCVAGEPRWNESRTGSDASLRGLAVAQHAQSSQPVIWASGAKGTILLSSDLGQTWQKIGPPQYADLEFRSLHAWNERQAIVASAGTPAIVLKTEDAGKSWREVHRDEHPKAFFDGLKFIDDQRGVLFGDPIDGRFAVLTTSDAGQTWRSVSPDTLPPTRDGEAAFAASNSAMIVAAPSSIWIGTGGAVSDHSRVMVSHYFGESWKALPVPLLSSASSGVFSLALSAERQRLVAVGGDYQPDAKSATTGAISTDGGETFTAPAQPPLGYRSSVVYANDRFIATGPAGTDYSKDGSSWTKLSDTGFHALAVLPDHTVIGVGSAGRFGLLK
jgi:photosystem II stability/assembly factor-like uncharacterized protein